jgi:hypothetical protein
MQTRNKRLQQQIRASLATINKGVDPPEKFSVLRSTWDVRGGSAAVSLVLCGDLWKDFKPVNLRNHLALLLP